MSLSTFEILPDEILMIIIRYSGDILTIFPTFFGLNQRINNILYDKRMHLLTDFLFIDNGDVNIDSYYNSDAFHATSRQLFTLKTIENKQQLHQCLQRLVAFHIKYKYKQSADQIELGLAQHQSIRMHLNDDEIQKVDMELEKTFKGLQNCSKPRKNIKEIQSLILTKGARLVCPDDPYTGFNFANAVNRLLLEKITNNRSTSHQLISSLIQMFKTLIISNLSLLYNRSYVVNGGCVIYFFLFRTIYTCRNSIYQKMSAVNMQYYRAAVDLLLFVLQCLNYQWIEENWWIDSFLDLLEFLSPMKLRIEQEIFVYTSQSEILNIVFDENILNGTSSDIDPSYRLLKSLGNLFICDRLDMILSIFHHDEHVRDRFQSCWNDPKFVSILTGNPMRRRMLHAVLNDISIGTWLATTSNLLFILLQKKECKLVKKLLQISPLLIHRVDDDGNDPLLYLCLKVRGCRERLIEYLIQIKCDGERRNANGEKFIDALQLRRNRKLLKKLVEQEIIRMEENSAEINIHWIK